MCTTTMPMEYVYGIGHPLGFIKIGRSTDPERRLSNLQTANPHELWLVFQVPCEDAHWLEDELHGLLSERRVRDDGEWFEYDHGSYRKIVRAARYVAENGTTAINSIEDLEQREARQEAAMLG